MPSPWIPKRKVCRASTFFRITVKFVIQMCKWCFLWVPKLHKLFLLHTALYTAGVDRRRLMEVVLQLSHLFETFAISSYPNFSTTGRSHTTATSQLPSALFLLPLFSLPSFFPSFLFLSLDKEEQDVLQLKLSHTLTLDLDTKHCSPEVSCKIHSVHSDQVYMVLSCLSVCLSVRLPV